MAFALVSLFEPSIVRNIYEFARIEPTLAHAPAEGDALSVALCGARSPARVLFQNHPMLPQEEFFVMLPNERATIGELQEEMSQMEPFKKNNWFPHKMHFFCNC